MCAIYNLLYVNHRLTITPLKISNPQVPPDCKDRLKPKLHARLHAPSQRQGQDSADSSKPLAGGDDAENEEEEEAVLCSVEDAQAGARLKALQAETGFHVLASMELEPVLDAFLAHMVPFEREEVGVWVFGLGFWGEVGVWVWVGRLVVTIATHQ